jgi:predicted alpha/beta hydrolase
MSAIAPPASALVSAAAEPLGLALQRLDQAPAVRSRDESLRCVDGRLIQARWTEPADNRALRAFAVMSPATAVAARFYRPFCDWLAARGYAVLSFDYRGIGESRAALQAGEDVRLRDWARLDMGAALRVAARRRDREAEARGRAVGLLWVGHSLGGNSVGLVPGMEQIDAVLGVAAQVASIRHWQGWAKLQAWVFFHLMLPGAVLLRGHAPGRMLGPRAEDLPAGAALEWARWGRQPSFLFSDESLANERAYDRFEGQVHLWSITDDHLFGPAAAVDALAREFTAAQVHRHVLAPADLGVKSIAHFGPFRRDLGARLWERLLAPVEATTPALRGMVAA